MNAAMSVDTWTKRPVCRTAALLALWLLLASCQKTPPLPTLEPSAFPEAVRNAVSEAQQAAAASPGDAAKTLHFGMILQARMEARDVRRREFLAQSGTAAAYFAWETTR